MTTQEVSEMTAEAVLGNRRWPAWFTVDQCRAQLDHEARGCPPPFEGAEWDGYSYRGPSWPGHSAHVPVVVNRQTWTA